MENIRHYSIAKFKGFLEAINELEKEEIKAMALSNRVSQAEKKDWEKFLKE